MPTPTPAQLNDPAFTQAIIAAIRNRPLKLETPIMDILRRPRPKFRKAREVHAQRARKLRRRGEYVHFERWEHGHCIYSWGGPPPQSITFRMHAQRR